MGAGGTRPPHPIAAPRLFCQPPTERAARGEKYEMHTRARRVTAVPSRTSAATPASCSRSRPRDNRRAAQAHHSAARRAGRASHRAVDASIAFVAARMAGDGLDAYDALWDTVASDDDDDVSEVRPVLPQRAHSGAPLPRRRSAMPPPYTHDELDRLYAAGCSRYDADDDDLDAGDALAALA
mmetsp:Transcript_54240/g.161042  ORF Transcript_54240/g.161042 Transcript_54240/m.161042 type:complete len:182 (+) Transcript_54240:642-1187(+)